MRRWTIDGGNDWQTSPTAVAVCSALNAGKLVAVPTETVYGLAADATNGIACARIFEAKGRPQFNPLISHVDSLKSAQLHGAFNEDAQTLAMAFWPGPLTLVVPKLPTSDICDLATAGLTTVALRVPSGAIMRFLARETGRPLAAPSANISGRISATSAEDAAADLGPSLSFVVDAGPCPVGIESTIVSCVDATPRLLRPGGIDRMQIEDVLGRKLQGPAASSDLQKPDAPGMLTSHYAPTARMRLRALDVRAGEALLSFGATRPLGAECAVKEINLSATGNVREAAARLFSALRELDTAGARTICVQDIPLTGLGEAINDRLQRAAAPRP